MTRNDTSPLGQSELERLFLSSIPVLRATAKKLSDSFQPGAQRVERNKPMKKLTKEQKAQIANVAAKKDADIDLSEMPEVIDWSGAEVGKYHRPPKKPVTMRLDADVLEWLKSYGEGYQTKANMLLRHAMAETARAAGHTKSTAKKARRA